MKKCSKITKVANTIHPTNVMFQRSGDTFLGMIKRKKEKRKKSIVVIKKNM